MLTLTTTDIPHICNQLYQDENNQILTFSDPTALSSGSWLCKYNTVTTNMCFKFQINSSSTFWVIVFPPFIPNTIQIKMHKDLSKFQIFEFQQKQNLCWQPTKEYCGTKFHGPNPLIHDLEKVINSGHYYQSGTKPNLVAKMLATNLVSFL